MDQLRAMRLFVRVAECGSLGAAGESLGLSRGAGSAILKDLERYFGVQLVARTTRRLRLTEEGEVYLERARAILADVESLEDEIGGAERRPRGLLRVQIPSGLARIIVAPALCEFAAEHPELQLHVLSRNHLPDFVADRLDAAVVVGELPPRDLVARSVGRLTYVTAAAPSYLARRGVPQGPADLAAHDCISALSTATGMPIAWSFREAGRETRVAVTGPLAFEGAEAAVAAALAGAGIVQLASYLVHREIREGRLAPVLDAYRSRGEAVNILHPRHRLKPKKLKVFEEFLLQVNREIRAREAARAGGRAGAAPAKRSAAPEAA